MRDLVLELETRRCVDGIELIRLDDPPDIRSRGVTAGPIWFSCRSDRYERAVIREAVDLADALVVRFVNANDDDKRVKFLSRFGLPHGFMLGAPNTGLPAEPRAFVLSEQQELRHLLLDAGSGDDGRAAKAVRRSLHLAEGGNRLSLRSDGRVALSVQTLFSFMRIEIAKVRENGARAALCKRCGDIFLYGKATNRRSTATYCRDLCRVGAHRAKNRNHKRS